MIKLLANLACDSLWFSAKYGGMFTWMYCSAAVFPNSCRAGCAPQKQSTHLRCFSLPGLTSLDMWLNNYLKLSMMVEQSCLTSLLSMQLTSFETNHHGLTCGLQLAAAFCCAGNLVLTSWYQQQCRLVNDALLMASEHGLSNGKWMVHQWTQQ